MEPDLWCLFFDPYKLTLNEGYKSWFWKRGFYLHVVKLWIYKLQNKSNYSLNKLKKNNLKPLLMFLSAVVKLSCSFCCFVSFLYLFTAASFRWQRFFVLNLWFFFPRLWVFVLWNRAQHLHRYLHFHSCQLVADDLFFFHDAGPRNATYRIWTWSPVNSDLGTTHKRE